MLDDICLHTHTLKSSFDLEEFPLQLNIVTLRLARSLRSGFQNSSPFSGRRRWELHGAERRSQQQFYRGCRVHGSLSVAVWYCRDDITRHRRLCHGLHEVAVRHCVSCEGQSIAIAAGLAQTVSRSRQFNISANDCLCWGISSWLWEPLRTDDTVVVRSHSARSGRLRVRPRRRTGLRITGAKSVMVSGESDDDNQYSPKGAMTLRRTRALVARVGSLRPLATDTSAWCYPRRTSALSSLGSSVRLNPAMQKVVGSVREPSSFALVVVAHRFLSIFQVSVAFRVVLC